MGTEAPKTRNKYLPFIIGGIVLVLLLCCGVGALASHTSTETTTSTSVQQDAPTNTPRVTKPTTIATFTGDGIKKTADFTVDADEWQLTWYCTDSTGGNLIVGVKNQDGSTFDIVAVNTICDSVKHDVTVEHGAGTYYLDVNAFGTWKMVITANQ
jgi:hypothetical protein